MSRVEAMTATDDFVRQADTYRPELLAHCYRMLGSVHDAEDLVQETYLRAWRSIERFEGRSSVRTWLYRIATNACLTALEQKSRRPLPSGLGPPERDARQPLAARQPEVPWLEPLPDALIAPDPGAVIVSRNTVRLAFVAALQHLPPRQRAVLILRDVLAWSAAEVAALLETSTAAVNSALQRARAQIADVMPAEDTTVEPSDADRRALLTRLVTTLEAGDVTSFVHLLREDAALEMPPVPTWFAGRDAVARFYADHLLDDPSVWRFTPTGANGQPAIAMYRDEGDGVYRAHNLQVLTLVGDRIAGVVAFRIPELFAAFGLPSAYPSAGAAG
jgi:RNA polymerase sigma-70 factor (ECF subfamily)